MKEHTLYKKLQAAFVCCGLKRITWYQATRHTYASHYVMDGGSLDALAQRLGHSTTEVTQRYAHFQQDRITEKELALVEVDLAGILPPGETKANEQQVEERAEAPRSGPAEPKATLH